jgi:hypothetical protein
MAGVRIKRDTSPALPEPSSYFHTDELANASDRSQSSFDNRNQNSLILQRTMFRDGMAAGSTPVGGEPR